jgi:hypothetical protein
MASLTYDVVSAGSAAIPAEVAAALEVPGPSVLVRATTDAGWTSAYLVASVTEREVEVFHLAEPDLGYPDGFVVAAAHFRDVGGRAFHDRYRSSPLEGSRPDERIHFCEALVYREPDQVVHREERPPGEVHEQVFSDVDISGKYLPWPAPGDWEPFVRFPGT